jgi:hypothetical protein
MLNRLRQPGSTLRSGRLMRACVALLSRALVPVGYMLGNDAPDGGFAVLLCPAHSELPADGQTLPVRAGASSDVCATTGDCDYFGVIAIG